MKKANKGYTLMEVIVAMTLGAMVISMLSVFHTSTTKIKGNVPFYAYTEAELLLRYLSAQTSASDTLLFYEGVLEDYELSFLSLNDTETKVTFLLFHYHKEWDTYVLYHGVYENPPTVVTVGELVKEENRVFTESIFSGLKLYPKIEIHPSKQYERTFLQVRLYLVPFGQSGFLYRLTEEELTEIPYREDMIESIGNTMEYGEKEQGRDLLLVLLSQ